MRPVGYCHSHGAIEPCALKYLIFFDRLLQAALHKSLDIDRIGTRSAQKCRGVKGAVVCAQSKALGIEHYAGQYCLRLAGQKLRFVECNLEYLRHQLAGR